MLVVGAKLRLDLIVAGGRLNVATPGRRAAVTVLTHCLDEVRGYRRTRRGANLIIVQAKRAVLKTDSQGRLKSVPTLPPDAQIEAIFLIPEPQDTTAPRTPPPELAGLKIVGDIMAPGIEQDDWGFTK